MLKNDILKKMTDLSPWGQRIHLIDDIFTNGPMDTENRWAYIKNFMPKDLSNMRVLDVGCNAGFFSMKAKELRADYVLGIDFEHYIKQANFIKDLKDVKGLEYKVCSVYNMPASDKFDLTLCLGLIYHLRHPFLVLHKLADCTKDMIIIETEVLAREEDSNKMRFIEHTYKNDGTTWWIPGEECLRGMLRSVGFRYVKTHAYPHGMFGDHYHLGVTEEGIEKGRRIIAIGLKVLDIERLGFFMSEIPDLDKEIDSGASEVDA